MISLSTGGVLVPCTCRLFDYLLILVSIFEMLTGTPPFNANTIDEVIKVLQLFSDDC